MIGINKKIMKTSNNKHITVENKSSYDFFLNTLEKYYQLPILGS